MNRKVKNTVAGLFAGGLAVYLVHIFHVVHIFGTLSTPDTNFESVKPVIILTDSTGKKDTMPLEENIKLKVK